MGWRPVSRRYQAPRAAARGREPPSRAAQACAVGEMGPRLLEEIGGLRVERERLAETARRGHRRQRAGRCSEPLARCDHGWPLAAAWAMYGAAAARRARVSEADQDLDQVRGRRQVDVIDPERSSRPAVHAGARARRQVAGAELEVGERGQRPDVVGRHAELGGKRCASRACARHSSPLPWRASSQASPASDAARSVS